MDLQAARNALLGHGHPLRDFSLQICASHALQALTVTRAVLIALSCATFALLEPTTTTLPPKPFWIAGPVLLGSMQT